jgi:hypothetical protein
MIQRKPSAANEARHWKSETHNPYSLEVCFKLENGSQLDVDIAAA